MGRGYAWALIALLSFTACGDDEASLVVELRTDYGPAVDFTAVETSVETDGVEEAAIPTAASSSHDFVAGRRVAQFDGLAPGRVLVRVTLRDDAGGLVATRLTRLDISGTTGLIVVISSSCADIRCPGAADDPSETECYDGRCVPPTCQPTRIETCGGVRDGGQNDAGDGGELDSTVPVVDSGPSMDSTMSDAMSDATPPVDSGEMDADTGPPDTGGGVDPTLVAWYACESLASGRVVDVTGNGHDGTCSGVRCPTIVTGRVGNACSFSRADRDEVRVLGLDAFDPSALTVALFVWHQGGSEGSMIGKPLGTGIANSWQLELRNFGGAGPPIPDTFLFSTGPDPDTWEHIDYYFPSDPTRRWLHVAGTWDGTELAVYVDGTRVLSEPGTIISDTHPVLIGFDENSGSPWAHIDALLDEIRIYSRALSSEEIAALAAER
jgi:hypothetical protein